MPMLVKEMFNSLVDNLDGAEPPYSLEKVISSYLSRIIIVLAASRL